MDASLLCASATAREELWPLPWMQLSDADAVVTSMFSAQKIGCNQQPMVNIGDGVLAERSVLDRLQAHCHGLPTKFARNLLRHVFGEAKLQGKSLYGKGTNRHKEDTVKEGLDPVRLNAVYGPGQGEGATAVQKAEDVASLDTKPGVCLGHQSSAHWKDPLPGGRVSSPGRTGQGSSMIQPATLEVRRTGAARKARGVAAILAQQPPQKSLGSPDCAGTAGRDNRQPGQQRQPE
ncbi:hypothetical protein HPB49_007015 [Dermacentor silvarum]|uniref:Uncharacterized protein n=1 Tax=Dermacentor silvarum TaxID=543639 RepID=A0ACB8CVT7_DERSI|nr:hypothetical protein HPB49_007015 [Dermacentor silvarum]